MSNLIFLALLSGVPWETIVRRLELDERARGVGDGRDEGYRYTIIHRDDEILIILPDYGPKEECKNIAKKLLRKLMPNSEIEVAPLGYASSHCNYCLKPTSLPYRCYRCRGWYCMIHRLPERHNCPNEEEGKEKAVRRIKPEKKKGEKVIITEIPCG